MTKKLLILLPLVPLSALGIVHLVNLALPTKAAVSDSPRSCDRGARSVEAAPLPSPPPSPPVVMVSA